MKKFNNFITGTRKKSKSQLFFEDLKKLQTDKYDNLLIMSETNKQYLKNYRIKQKFFNLLNQFQLQQKIYKNRKLVLELLNIK